VRLGVVVSMVGIVAGFVLAGLGVPWWLSVLLAIGVAVVLDGIVIQRQRRAMMPLGSAGTPSLRHGGHCYLQAEAGSAGFWRKRQSAGGRR
jgi:hypothetical protein